MLPARLGSRGKKLFQNNSPDLLGPGIFSPRTFTTSLTQQLAQNADLKVVAVGGNGLVASLLSRPDLSRRVTCFSSESWLPKINPCWDEQPWGQSPRYLPAAFRTIAEEMLGLPDNRLMTFKEMSNIELIGRQQLREQGYALFEDKITSIVQDGEQVAVESTDGSKKIVQGNLVVNAARTHLNSLNVNVRASGCNVSQ